MTLPADWNTVTIDYHAYYLDGTQPTGLLEIEVSWDRVVDDDATDPVWIIGDKLTIPINPSGPTTFTLPTTDDTDITGVASGWSYKATEVFDNGDGGVFYFQAPAGGTVYLPRVALTADSTDDLTPVVVAQVLAAQADVDAKYAALSGITAVTWLGITSVMNPTFGVDNTGANDTVTAIHAARDSINTTVLFFPKGTYKCSTQLTANAGQQWILAPGAVIQCSGGSVHGINVTAGKVIIDGPGKIDTGAGSTGAGVMINNNLADITVQRVEIANGTYGVRCKGSSGPITQRLRVVGCTIHDTSSHGVFFNWETTDSEITQNQFYNNGGNGIWFGNSSHRVRAINNVINNSGRIGIESFGSNQEATIMGNTINICTSIGISCDSNTGSRVIGNSVHDPGSYGYELAGSNFCIVKGNYTNLPTIGISISAVSGTCDDNTIADNIIDHPSSGGIIGGGSANGAKRLRVINNEIIEPGNGSGAQTAIGGTTGIGVENWVVVGNTVKFITNPVSSIGVGIAGPGHLIASNHFVYDAGIVTAGSTAISLSSTNVDCVVDSNIVYGNTKCNSGIVINAACTGILVTNNRITGTQQNTIQNNSASTTIVITGNLTQPNAGADVTMGSAVGANKAAGSNRMVHTGPTRFDGNIGFYGTTPIAQPTAPTAVPAAAPAGGTGTAAGAWDTAANRDAAIATINGLRTTVSDIKTKLQALGITL